MSDERLRILIIGAHPDDADIKAGGTAAKWCALGHVVRLVSLTNGQAGHQTMPGPRAGPPPTSRGTSGRRGHRRDLRGLRSARRRARRPPGISPASDPPDPIVSARPDHHAPLHRLPPRPSIRGLAGPGCVLPADRARHLSRRAPPAVLPRDPLLLGRLQEALPLRAARRRGHRGRVRSARGHAALPSVPVLRVAAVQRRLSRPGAGRR